MWVPTCALTPIVHVPPKPNIEGFRSARRERVEGKNVGVNQIADMDVVSDAGAVFGGVIRASNCEPVAPTCISVRIVYRTRSIGSEQESGIPCTLLVHASAGGEGQ